MNEERLFLLIGRREFNITNGGGIYVHSEYYLVMSLVCFSYVKYFFLVIIIFVLMSVFHSCMGWALQFLIENTQPFFCFQFYV